jgi:alpha,alpha-trehalase
MAMSNSHIYHPKKSLGSLFTDVAFAEIVQDDKSWADAIPLFQPDQIVEAYDNEKNKANFDIEYFISKNFSVHDGADHKVYKTVKDHTLVDHIRALWKELERKDKEGDKISTTIALPYPYIIPGGRFKEIYYWDSYFTMLGLREHGMWDMIESMVNNFSWMIDQFGFIPNGSRSYYLTRSQPPFFSLMVALLAENKGDNILMKYRDTLIAEYHFWTNPENPRMATAADGAKFTRYYDAANDPRIEMYATDVRLKEKLSGHHEFFREIRAACESGWDFSSRWLDESGKLESIRTLNIVPIDLECLLWHLEHIIARAYHFEGNVENHHHYSLLAEKRKDRIHKYFWNTEKGFYCDYDISKNAPSSVLSLAGLFPLYFGLVSQEYADITLNNLKIHFLRPGGLVTTLAETGQQWDAPNGWAPLQWIGYSAAMRYGHQTLANEIAQRWIGLNEKVFYSTGKMLEKYNVEDVDAEGGGGEYPVQDGFGWTNGVYLALKSRF